MVGIDALEVVNVQRHARVVHEALEEFVGELGVKTANAACCERDVQVQAWAALEVDHHAAQRLVQRPFFHS